MLKTDEFHDIRRHFLFTRLHMKCHKLSYDFMLKRRTVFTQDYSACYNNQNERNGFHETIEKILRTTIFQILYYVECIRELS